jgi:hypothetical protein
VFKATALLKATHSTLLRAGLLRQPFCFVHRLIKLSLLKQKKRRYALKQMNVVGMPLWGILHTSIVHTSIEAEDFLHWDFL